jgi:hypothetical protein
MRAVSKFPGKSLLGLVDEKGFQPTQNRVRSYEKHSEPARPVFKLLLSDVLLQHRHALRKPGCSLPDWLSEKRGPQQPN